MRYLWWGPYAGVDYNLTLCPLQSRRLQVSNTFTMGLGNPYARVDSGTSDLALEPEFVNFCELLKISQIRAQEYTLKEHSLTF
jgi:hypothetical protein